MLKAIVLLTAVPVICLGQVNTWQRVVANDTINWTQPAFFYSRSTGEFVMTMGTQDETGANSPYCVQVYKPGIGKWINALPHDSLYGKWADSSGYARANGRCGNGVFGTYYWAFKSIDGYLRPNTGAFKATRAYGQFAVSSGDGKVYFYINNCTFTYSPTTRRWDTLSTDLHPNSGAIESYLKWGTMCYDAYNQEVLLCGGGALDKDSSRLGTWTFKPSNGVWTQLTLATQPGPRANAAMAYDAQNRVIVLFGGDHLDYYYGDTWIYDCAARTWTQRHPSMNPKPRAGHSLLYLPKSKRVVLLGGHSRAGDQGSAYEMWAYDLSANAWGLIKRFSGTGVWPKTAGVKCPATGFAAVDTNDMIAALGDSAPSIYYFHPSIYRLQCDPTQIDAAGTAANGIARDTMNWRSDGTWEDPAWFTNGVAAPDTAANESFLKGMALNTWYKTAQPKVPGGGTRAWSSTILDPDRDQFLKFGGGHVAHCGTDIDHYGIHTNRYSIGYRPEYPLEYDGDNECRPGPFTFNNRPFMHVHNTHAYDYDVNLHRMVFVAGMHSYVYNPDVKDWDTTHIHSTFGGGGYNTGLAQTPHGLVCLYGNDYATNANAVYLFDGSPMNWRKLTSTGASLPTFYADNTGVIYDSKRDRLVIAKGDATATAGLWSFSFATGAVTRLNAADSSIATGSDHYRDLVYLPNIDKVVFGIRQTQGHLAYDCAANRWGYYPIALDATAAGSAAMLDDRGAGYMYDARRNLVWVSDHMCGVYVMRPDTGLGTGAAGVLTAQEIRGMTLTIVARGALLSVRLTGRLKNGAQVRIYDVTGRLVADLSRSVMHGSAVWNADQARSAACLVLVRESGRTFVKKFMVTQ